MNKPDSAKIQFYRRKAEYCSCVQCGRLMVQLEIDFGSLLPEIETTQKLTVSICAPLDHWIFAHAIEWWADKDPCWSMIYSRKTVYEAEATVRLWIARARGLILGMTGREILAALESGTSIAVAIDSAVAVAK